MQTRQLIGLAAATLLLASCQSDIFRINGIAKEYADGDTLLLTIGDDGQPSNPTVPIVVEKGKFRLKQRTDTTIFCSLRSSHQPQCNVTFFMEPGEKVRVELGAEPGTSRISGSRINNEWQKLCSLAEDYGRTLCETAGQAGSDSLTIADAYNRTSRLYSEMNEAIRQTATRNSDNALGLFLSTHYLGE